MSRLPRCTCKDLSPCASMVQQKLSLCRGMHVASVLPQCDSPCRQGKKTEGKSRQW